MRKLIVFLDFLLFAGFAFADLSCTTRNGACNVGEIELFQMSSTANAHAAIAGGPYPEKVCCSDDIVALGNDCGAAESVVVLKLSNTTNAHVEEGVQTNYSNNVCLSVLSGSISCSYKPSAPGCDMGEACVAILDNATNSHVNRCGGAASGTSICCSAFGPAKFKIVSFVLDPAIVLRDAPSKNVKATVKVKNYSSNPATARVELTVADSSGNSPVSIPFIVQPVGASAVSAFEFMINVASTWNSGIYSATAKVFDTGTPAKLHDSKLSYFTVSEIKNAVPEFNAILLPLVALLVLAIVLLETKRKK